MRSFNIQQTEVLFFKYLNLTIATNDMFYVLKLLLLILFNRTYAYIDQDNEILLLPAWKPTDTKEIQLTLKTFKKQIQLNLRRNNQIVSFAFKDKVSQSNISDFCFYFYTNQISTAVINFCDNGWKGVVSLKGSILKIRSLRNDFTSLSSIDNLCVKIENNLSFGQPHFIKRSLHSFLDLDKSKQKQRYVRNSKRKLTVKLAVFVDEAAYRSYMPFFNENEEMLRSMILAYVNYIQAMFHHPSLDASINILLVHLEIMKKQPSNLPTFDGDAIKLHDSFCKYSKTRNSLNNNDLDRWDVGLYLTGIDIHFKTNFRLLGKAYNNSTCDNKDKSCVIVEFGFLHKFYSGFASSLIAVHEISHALGMEHDSEVGCIANKYVMSAYGIGQLTWSECSRKVAKKLWFTKQCLRTGSGNFEFHHSLYHDLPGRKWTAKAQCELFYRDKDANVVSHDVCNNLQCETPNNYRYDFTGPALEGTHCAYKKECRGRECVPIIEPPYLFKYCKRDIWSAWKKDSCRSNCLQKSKGVRVKRRYCKHLAHRTANCAGPYYNVTLCDDSALCSKKRSTITEFTTRKCRNFSHYITELEAKGSQAVHEIDKPWLACTIFCKQKLLNQYVPSLEMLNFHIDPYFPDGTWCHNEDGQDYYCRQHYCVAESYS